MNLKIDIHTILVVLLDSSLWFSDDVLGAIDFPLWIKLPATILGAYYLWYRGQKMKYDSHIARIERDTKEQTLELLRQLTESKTHEERIANMEMLSKLKETRINNV